jgi:hypothetical protein
VPPQGFLCSYFVLFGERVNPVGKADDATNLTTAEVSEHSACGLSAEPSEMLNGTILLLARRDHAQQPVRQGLLKRERFFRRSGHPGFEFSFGPQDQRHRFG